MTSLPLASASELAKPDSTRWKSRVSRFHDTLVTPVVMGLVRSVR